MKLVLMTFLATVAFADTPPVPKVFKGLSGQKGQYQVDILESGGKSSNAPQKMTICTDNLMSQSQAKGKGRSGSSSCTHTIHKDTADEAIVETTCDGRTSKVTMKRESAKSLLMSMESTGAKGPQTMKMRYTHLGACREGQGTVSLDPNSDQCRQMREAAAKMKDPETRKRLEAMCR